jgi:hypothetical protein
METPTKWFATLLVPKSYQVESGEKCKGSFSKDETQSFRMKSPRVKKSTLQGCILIRSGPGNDETCIAGKV